MEVTRARFELFAAQTRGMEWRFVASNNHVIAVGGDRMTDVASARATLAALQEVLPDAKLGPARRGLPGVQGHRQLCRQP